MNVTPLVDVVLVLLIIFMVVLPALQDGVTVELPSIAHADDDAESATAFTLSLTADGTLYLDRERVEASAHRAALVAAHEQFPARRVVLRADGAVDYAHVRSVMRLCQDVGFRGVSLRVNERTGDD